MADTLTDAEAEAIAAAVDAEADKEIAAMLAALPADDVDAAREALTDTLVKELVGVVEYLRPVPEKHKRRIRLYLYLSRLGYTNRQIADHVGTTTEAVRQTLLKAHRGRDGT